jgi:hypothetical protein
MESIAPYTRIRDGAGQREALCYGREGTMKCGVETGDLRQLGPCQGNRANGSDIVRHVDRIERNKCRQRLQQRWCYALRRNVITSAVNHPVADSCQSIVAGMCVNEFGQLAMCRLCRAQQDAAQCSGQRPRRVTVPIQASLRRKAQISGLKNQHSGLELRRSFLHAPPLPKIFTLA